jgi:hypothetical protein
MSSTPPADGTLEEDEGPRPRTLDGGRFFCIGARFFVKLSRGAVFIGSSKLTPLSSCDWRRWVAPGRSLFGSMDKADGGQQKYLLHVRWTESEAMC